MQIDDVISACEALAIIGKKPTIALVKTKVLGQIPLAVIVKGIQTFQSNSKLPSALGSQSKQIAPAIDAKTSAEKQCNCEDRVIRLENEITKMSACITALQVQVKALIEQ